MPSPCVNKGKHYYEPENHDQFQNNFAALNETVQQVTERIVARSQNNSSRLSEKIEAAKSQTVHRAQLACGNLAHGFAACQSEDKNLLKNMVHNDIAIITAYNDMLSAHKPYEDYPQKN